MLSDFMAIHPVIAGIFQSGPQRWTGRPTYPEHHPQSHSKTHSYGQ